MNRRVIIPVWFFVGVLVGIYGALIMGSGLLEWSHPAQTVLAGLHAPVWWGCAMFVFGVIYSIAFRPRAR